MSRAAYEKLQDIVDVIGTCARREADDPEEYYGGLLRLIDDLCHDAMDLLGHPPGGTV